MATSACSRQKIPLISAVRAKRSRISSHHYDISNAFYANYSSTRTWSIRADTSGTGTDSISIRLQSGQARNHVCKKLRLNPGDRLLDIGCGWGARSLIHAAQELWRDRRMGFRCRTQQTEYGARAISCRTAWNRQDHASRFKLADYEHMVKGQFRQDFVNWHVQKHMGIQTLPAPIFPNSATPVGKPNGWTSCTMPSCNFPAGQRCTKKAFGRKSE